jgi:hypothetical protein
MRRYVLGKSELCSRNFGFVGLVWAVNVMAKHWQAPGGAAGLLLAYPLWKTKCRIPCATVNLQTAVVFNRIRIADIYCPPFKESACSRCNSSNAWGGKYADLRRHLKEKRVVQFIQLRNQVKGTLLKDGNSGNVSVS